MGHPAALLRAEQGINLIDSWEMVCVCVCGYAVPVWLRWPMTGHCAILQFYCLEERNWKIKPWPNKTLELTLHKHVSECVCVCGWVISQYQMTPLTALFHPAYPAVIPPAVWLLNHRHNNKLTFTLNSQLNKQEQIITVWLEWSRREQTSCLGVCDFARSVFVSVVSRSTMPLRHEHNTLMAHDVNISAIITY